MSPDYVYLWVGRFAYQFGVNDFQARMPRDRFWQEYDNFKSPCTGLAARTVAFKEYIIDLLLGI